MSEWWTYSLSDFLLFSPRTYYRLLELYNLAIWPTQLAALATRRSHSGHAETGQHGGADHHGRPRTPVAVGCLGLFPRALRNDQLGFWLFRHRLCRGGSTLIWVGGFREVSFRLSPDASRAGLAISAFAMFLYPLIAPALGRPWTDRDLRHYA